jgi:hypothetical protein
MVSAALAKAIINDLSSINHVFLRPNVGCLAGSRLDLPSPVLAVIIP